MNEMAAETVFCHSWFISFYCYLTFSFSSGISGVPANPVTNFRLDPAAENRPPFGLFFPLSTYFMEGSIFTSWNANANNTISLAVFFYILFGIFLYYYDYWPKRIEKKQRFWISNITTRLLIFLWGQRGDSQQETGGQTEEPPNFPLLLFLIFFVVAGPHLAAGQDRIRFFSIFLFGRRENNKFSLSGICWYRRVFPLSSSRFS